MTTLDLPVARPSVGPLPAPVRHSLSLAWRTLLRIRRTPEQLLDVTLQPPIFIVLFVYVFGGAIAGTQHDYLQYVLPSLMVQTVIFGTIAIGSNLNDDIKNGVFDRFRSLPISRSAPLVGAVFGDVIRYSIAIIVTLAFGMALGFRVSTNPLEAFAACLLVLGFALCLCWVSIFLGMLVRESGAVQGLGFLFLFPLTFGSTTFVKADTMPGWLQAWVKVNPVTHLNEAVRNLMIGGPVAGPVMWWIGWAALFLVIFAPLAVRAYRRKA
jgi:ABC-type polysaccharide/polyol phosphate export systems, permease component